MRTSKIPHIRIAIALSLVFIVAVAAVAFYLQGLLNPDNIKRHLLEEINRRIGCTGECTLLTVSLFPRPKATVHDPTISFGSDATFTARSLTILPQVLPLLRGRVEVAEVDLESPVATISLPRVLPDTDTRDPAAVSGPSATVVQNTIFPLFALLASQESDSFIRIHKGVLSFYEGSKHAFRIEDLSGVMTYGGDKVAIDISSTSTLWERFALKGRIDPSSHTSTGLVNLDGFHPQTLFSYLCPDAPLGIGDSLINAEMSFTSEGPGNFNADFHGSIPALSLLHSPGEFVLRSEEMHGAIRVTPETFDLAVTRFNLQDPQISLTGDFHVDFNPRHTRLQIDVKDMDLASVRRAALVLGGENRKIQKTFEVVKGGCIPLISLNANADTPEHLFDSENYVITGNILGGEIYVPRPNLHVDQVKGDVLISRGTLKGSNLHGLTGNSIGSNGNLIVGLVGDDPPFHLDIDIDANLADLPPVLYRVVKNKAFLEELNLARDIQGAALGKLILGERLENIDTRVEVKNFTLSADYQRLSHPFSVKGTAFLLGVSEVSAESLVGAVGQSSFSDVSVKYSWLHAPHLQVNSLKPARIDLAEFYPWLISHEKVRKGLDAFSSAEGTVWVDRFDLKGPLFDLNSWSLKTSGRVENLKVNSKYFPGPIKTATGKFEATKDTLTLQDFQSVSSDASLLATLTLKGYLEGLTKVDTTASGTIGQHSHEWIYDLIHLPAEYRMRSPLTLSQSHLSWEKEGKVTFKADLSLQEELQCSLDLLVDSGNLAINRLAVKDRDSDATVSLALRNDDFDFTLDGTLSKPTADRLFADNQLLDGWISGHITCHILPDNLLNSTSEGKLDVHEFEYFWRLHPDIRIERASLVASGNELNVLSSSFDWEDSHLLLSGKVSYSPTRLGLDVDVVADNLDWQQVKRLQSDDTSTPAGSEGALPAGGIKYNGVPLSGVVRIKTDLFNYGKLNWGPVSAGFHFQGDTLKIDITEANLCGMQTPGTISLSPGGTRLEIKPTATNADVDTALVCLWDRQGLMDGTFNLTAAFTANHTTGSLLKSLRGEIEVTAFRGRVYRFEFLSKVFAMLNVTEIYRGQLPDLLKEGCPYETIHTKATLQNGVLKIQESEMDGLSVRMVGKGDVDLNTDKIDATVLVSPLKTVDTIISHVPIIGGILGGSLVSIPVGVLGSISDPDVIPLAPSAVGSELVGYMKRTFQIPLKLLQPLL